MFQIDYNEEDGTVTVTFDDTPAGDEPFSSIVVDVTNPDGSPVSVTDVELKACVEEGKNSYDTNTVKMHFNSLFLL